jgi:hypothetical protein
MAVRERIDGKPWLPIVAAGLKGDQNVETILLLLGKMQIVRVVANLFAMMSDVDFAL